MFAFRNAYGSDSSFTCIFGDVDYIYSKNKKEIGNIKIDSTDIFPVKFKIFKSVIDIMQFCGNVEYKMYNMPTSPFYNLRTLKKVVLKKMPFDSSKIIDHIAANTELLFLGYSKKQDTINNKIWIWYKVKTENGKEGWIFGYPDMVDMLTDENGD